MKTCNKCGLEKPFSEYYSKGGAQKHLYRATCKPCHKKASLTYDQENPEQRSARYAKWRKKNLPVMAAHQAKARAQRLLREVKWADVQYIKDVYANAAEATKLFGVPFEVDHVVPLQGKLVSGLHVEDNLQVLPKHQNRSKNNAWTI